MRKPLLAYLLAALMTSGAAAAAQPAPDLAQALEAAGAHWADGRFDEGIALLATYEDSADPEVDAMLATLLVSRAIEGAGVDDAGRLDLSRPIFLAERAAAAGSGMALNLLYQIHANGFGVPVDIARARDYLERAVAAGDPAARVNQAVVLFEGNAVLPRDRDRACALFAQMLDQEQPTPFAAYYMGLARGRGHCGFEADPAAGVELIAIAARRGIREAERDLGRAHESGWGTPLDLGKALEWFQRAADHGEPWAQWRIGMSYVDGERGPKDSVRAIEWFRRSAAAGNPEGMTSLAVMYATGDGVPKDLGKTFALYQQAIRHGGTHPYRALAFMYLVGEGVQPDAAQAWIHYQKGQALGNPADEALARRITLALTTAQRAAAEAELAAWRAGQAR